MIAEGKPGKVLNPSENQLSKNFPEIKLNRTARKLKT